LEGGSATVGSGSDGGTAAAAADGHFNAVDGSSMQLKEAASANQNGKYCVQYQNNNSKKYK
jgi:hypothetical protein